MNKLKKKVSAFTLTEVLVAVAIAGILIGLAVGAIHKARQKAVEARAPVDIHDMKIALEQYNADHGAYPPSGNKNLVLAAEPYTEINPKNIKDGEFIDPWGKPYNYENPGRINPGGYDLTPGGGPGGISPGAGLPGGGGGILPQINPNVLVATPNNGFVHLGWPSVTNGLVEATDYNIYRSLTSEGSYDKLTSQAMNINDWIDKVPANDTTYYYKLQAVFGNGVSALSNPVSATPTSNNEYSLMADRALSALGSSSAGAGIAADISKYNVPVLFGYRDPAKNTLAWFSPYWGAIMINADTGYSQNAYAALLAHEGTHLQWYLDKTLGTPTGDGTPRSYNSIDQEYHAFSNGAAVWKELKNGELNRELDEVVKMIGLGEQSAKDQIRSIYNNGSSDDLKEYSRKVS